MKKNRLIFIALIFCLIGASAGARGEDSQYWRRHFPQYEYIELGGLEIHVSVVGEGSPVVLVHGIGWGFDMFRDVIPDLARHHRVYAFDFPGAGYSAKPTGADYSMFAQYQFLKDFMDYYQIQNAVIWGHSMGGASTTLLADAHPELARCVILSDIAYEWDEIPSTFIRLMRLPIIGKVGEWFPLKLAIRQVLGEIYADPQRQVTEEKVNRFHDILRRPGGAAAFRATLRTFKDIPRLKQHLPNLKMPALILWGEADRWFPAEQARVLQKMIPASELQILPNSGHMVIEEAAPAVVQLSEDFIARRCNGL